MAKWFSSRRCLSEQDLAAYADQQLIGTERVRVERHITTCDACLAQVAFLVRSATTDPNETPSFLFTKAAALGKVKSQSSGFRWHWAAAAGALAVIVIAALQSNVAPSQPSPAVAEKETRSSPTIVADATRTKPLQSLADESTVRGRSREVAWGLSSPKAGETVDAANLQFRWEPRSGAASYELKVVSEDGNVLWEQRTESTSAKMPASVHLVKGKTYYVWLSVHTASGQIDRAKAVEFVAGRTT
jgi:hypothetical protein